MYSSTDEIVQPMSGTRASAYINDARSVGASNSEIQTVCNGTPAGVFATHESILYHPLAYALAVDALTHPGAGETSRLDLDTICNTIVSPGLSLADVIATEGKEIFYPHYQARNSNFISDNIPIAGVAIELYANKVVDEPALMAYATY